MIEAQRKYVEELKNNDPAKVLQSQQAFLDKLIAHPDQLVISGDSTLRTVDSISRYPQRVAFLIDQQSGSSSEFFVFEGKQTKKVTLFGTNTAGVMDYGNAHSMPLSCGQYQLGIARGRNGWIDRFGYRIDNVGFAPDVRIPATEKDWIGFVMKYWSK
jgi:C-terminal processing protease CtpA/Prc